MAFDTDAVCTYNGITFGGNTEVMSLSSKPVYDRAGRTVVYVVHSLTLRTILVSVGSTDAALQAMRTALLVPGQRLSFSSQGFGSFAINVGGVKDVVWGPKPQMMSYKPIGIAAAEVTWQVDVAIPECVDPSYENQLMEFNYRLDFSIDGSGYTTRTHNGYITIPQTRSGGRGLSDSADEYWEGVNPKIPSGFRRTDRTRTLDESKCRLDFTIIDVEMGPNIPPAGVILANASHRIRNVPPGLVKWSGSIHAEYEVPRSLGPETCWKHFFQLVKQRVKASQDQLAQPNNKANKKADGGIVIPIGFEFGEPEIYGRPKAEFDFHYLITGLALKDLLKTSSMWMPVDNSWDLWRVALDGNAFNSRGNAALRFDRKDDVIIDLCISRRQVQLIAQPNREQPVLRVIQEELDLECPPEENSWIDYKNEVQFETDKNVIEHKPLPLRTQRIHSLSESQYPGTNYPPSSTGFSHRSEVDAPDSIVHKRTEDGIEIFLVGRAVRACYDIPPPKLKKFGKNEVVEANRADRGEGFRTRMLGNYGIPVIEATWRIRYIIPTRKRQLTTIVAPGTPSAPRDTPHMSTVNDPTFQTVPGFEGK